MNENELLLKNALDEVNELRELYRQGIQTYNDLNHELTAALSEIDSLRKSLLEFQKDLEEQRLLLEEE